MGLFQSRPEEPDAWAGIPAEPWQPRVPGEMLPPAVDDLGALSAGGFSISVPIEPVAAEAADAKAEGAEGTLADGNGD